MERKAGVGGKNETKEFAVGVKELEGFWKWGFWKVGEKICYHQNCTVL